MNSELCDVEVWLCKATDATLFESKSSDRLYFLSLSRVSYNRENETRTPGVTSPEFDAEVPKHRLVIHDLKGSWTVDNRDVAFGLFDSYISAQLLKRNVSTDALRGFKVEGQRNSPTRSRQQSQQSSTSPASTISKGHAASMLQKLIAEAETVSIAYTEDSETIAEAPQLHGVTACQTNDVLQRNWLIELVNSQVLLRGCETSGYVIVSAAKTQIWQTIHRPVWKDRNLLTKTSWVGTLDCMQYYATVDVGNTQNDQVVWLGVDNIEERDSATVISDLPDLVGSGQSVGGVVSSVVGTFSRSETAPIQLQRIVSRCSCQFFYASYGENVDLDELDEVPPLPDDDLLLMEPWDREIAVDAFTLTHTNLEISTNSQQYAMIVDLVNNLLLYVEPRKKEFYERQQRMRFSMQLSSVEDQRGPISQLQDEVRSLMARLKRLEKESYTRHKSLIEERGTNSALEEKLSRETKKIDSEMEECKNQLNANSEELALMINCYKEAQVSATKTKERQAAAQEAGGIFIATVIRRSEVCFKHASWRLTDADGQLGLADLVLSNFLYTKVAKNDDSVEHSFELGYIHVSNLLPNQVYKDVLEPTELQPNIPLDRRRALRIFCRERAPVAGISVKEHLEVNVIPLTIALTFNFVKNMMKFFFPDRDEVSNSNEVQDDQESASKAKKKTNLKREEASAASTLSVNTNASGSSNHNQAKSDDIEKMRQRAQKNHSFLYIKIPEVPIKISYKGRKEKNIANLNNVSLNLPTIEYHNHTWTWLDLLMALKSDTKRVLISQAVKQKLHLTSRRRKEIQHVQENEASKQHNVEQEENEDQDKARLLLGDLVVPSSTNSLKRSNKGLSIFGHKK